MSNPRWLLFAACTLLLMAPAAQGAGRSPVAAAESAYADWLDAGYALNAIDADPGATPGALGRSAWLHRRSAAAASLTQRLARLRSSSLNASALTVVEALERGFATPPTAPTATAAGQGAAVCANAAAPALERLARSAALYACFEHHGNHIRFENRVLVRSTALQLLQELDDGARRQALFMAFAPLWAAVNSDNAATSPYRRLVRDTADAALRGTPTPIEMAARTLGTTPTAIEGWLVTVLEAWANATQGSWLEPWDYWHAHSTASRALDALVPANRILDLDRAFYRDLGADLDGLGVQHDLVVREGKAPLAYSDIVRIGRYVHGRWRAPLARVSASVDHGGLYVLNEIIHEDGHSVHACAIRTRPAFFALGDDLLIESFADVTSWSVAEPAWQLRYLGTRTDERASLRALYAGVMLDVAWGLFELRMLREPSADPNALWSEITSRYLHVVPHPELSWWALRVQLVDDPGYLINYGLGALVTAEMRARTAAAIGPFDAGNARWYPWMTQHLLRFGASLPTPELLQRFLGHPVSPRPLLEQLARVGAAPPAP